MLHAPLRRPRPAFQARASVLLASNVPPARSAPSVRRASRCHDIKHAGVRDSARPLGSAQQRWSSSTPSSRTGNQHAHAVAQTILADGNSQFDIASAIANIQPLKHADPKTGSLVLLVSKKLHYLLHNVDTLVQPVLARLWSQNKSTTQVTVLAAVVDQISSTLQGSHVEGISLLASPAAQLFELDRPLQDMEDSEESLHTRALKLDEQPPTITFSISNGAYNETLDIMLPIAQTIFEANRPCTVSASAWTVQGSVATPMLTKTPLSGNFKVHVPSSAAASTPDLSMPLAQLTGPREIKTVMGNVVRELTISSTSVDQHFYGEVVGQEGGRDTSASKELETAVAALMRMELVQRHPVSVWALVVPPPLDTSAAYAALMRSTNLALEKLRQSTHSSAHLAALCELVWQGATLRRVLSGGGGWGNKSGLLSLEPSTDYAQKRGETVFDFDGADPMSFLKGVASPGDKILFYVGTAELKRAGAAPTESPPDSAASTATFGVAPNLADALPVPRQADTQQTLRNHFGMSSELGMSIRAPQTRTRLDVPLAHLTARTLVTTRSLHTSLRNRTSNTDTRPPLSSDMPTWNNLFDARLRAAAKDPAQRMRDAKLASLTRGLARQHDWFGGPLFRKVVPHTKPATQATAAKSAASKSAKRGARPRAPRPQREMPVVPSGRDALHIRYVRVDDDGIAEPSRWQPRFADEAAQVHDVAWTPELDTSLDIATNACCTEGEPSAPATDAHSQAASYWLRGYERAGAGLVRDEFADPEVLDDWTARVFLEGMRARVDALVLEGEEK